MTDYLTGYEIRMLKKAADQAVGRWPDGDDRSALANAYVALARMYRDRVNPGRQGPHNPPPAAPSGEDGGG